MFLVKEYQVLLVAPGRGPEQRPVEFQGQLVEYLEYNCSMHPWFLLLGPCHGIIVTVVVPNDIHFYSSTSVVRVHNNTPGRENSADESNGSKTENISRRIRNFRFHCLRDI